MFIVEDDFLMCNIGKMFGNMLNVLVEWEEFFGGEVFLGVN